MGTLAQGLPFPGEPGSDRVDLHHHSSRPSPFQPDSLRHYSPAAEPGRYRDPDSLAPHQLPGPQTGRAVVANAVTQARASGTVDRATVDSHSADPSSPAGPNLAHSASQARSSERSGQPAVAAGRAPQSDYRSGSMNNSDAARSTRYSAAGDNPALYDANGHMVRHPDERRLPEGAGRAAPEAAHERASSSYGVDGHVGSSRQPAQTYRASPSPADSPTRSTQSMQSVRQTAVDRASKRDSNSGSGSGSHSSHSLEHGSQHIRPRMSQAPYASSRAASLYGFPSSASNSAGDSIPPPPPAQLLDQSHLQVGDMASLLSHDKTLELYRQNAKKTNDPDIQYEFCVFVMDVVADLEYTAMLEKATTGQSPADPSQPPSQQELESKQKQQALVAESIALLNRLATRGHVNSCFFLGDCYTQGIGTYKVSLFTTRTVRE